jgi:hypothetical protein
LGIESDQAKDFVNSLFEFAQAANGGNLTAKQHAQISKMLNEKLSTGEITTKLIEETVEALKPSEDGTPSALNQAALLLFTMSGAPGSLSEILGVSGLLSSGTYTAAQLKAILSGVGWTILRANLAFFTAWAIQNMLLPVSGTDQMDYFQLLLDDTLMASRDDSKTNPQVVAPALADFAGTPQPEDPCGDPSNVIYREGNPSPGNLKARPIDEGMLSFRSSISNPLYQTGRPVLRPGEPYFGININKLPPGSVTFDNNPPGHVSVNNVDPDILKDAVCIRGKFPK